MKFLLTVIVLSFGLSAFASGGGGGGTDTTSMSDMIETQSEKKVTRTKKTVVMTEEASLELMEALKVDAMKGKIVCKTQKVAACEACDAFVQKPVCKITTSEK